MAESTYAVFNLGSQRVSAAVFSKGRNGDLILKAYDHVDMFGDPSVETTRLPQLRVALLELVDKLKLKGKNVWYTIAGHVVFTRFVKLPPSPEDKAEQMVEFEARQHVPFPINEVIWDYEYIGEPIGLEREVALVAIKAEALNDINDQVESVGVKVVGVDLAPLAVYNAFRYSYPDVTESALIVDLGAKSTNLVFTEGQRVFTRNILVGGSTVSGAISKELGMSFSDAEEIKRARGYVAPGGAYEPHEDETVEAVSKVMRNIMTRLHGEIVRTINYYRTQQSGSPPRRIFLCGGGAQTALVADFFQEKFNLPVEILNPLRGVQVSPGVNSAEIDANAPSLAELVGLGLRQVGEAPVEVELVPDSVESARDSARRAPYLILAMLSLFAVLGVGILYFKKAVEVIDGKLAKDTQELRELEKNDKGIRDLDKQLASLIGQSGQIEQVINDRDYWKRLLSTLNSKFDNDLIWLTDIEVLDGNSSLMTGDKAAVPAPAANARAGQNAKATAAAANKPATAAAPVDPLAPQPSPYSLRVRGLYRKNEQGGADVVYRYFAALQKVGNYFTTSEEKPKVDFGRDEERYAYEFSFRLPLVKGMQFKK